jgi:hypothetical protein
MIPVVVVPRAALLWSERTGVGHEEEPLSSVGRSDVGGGDDARLHSIPGGVEVGRNSVQPARNEGAHVFDDHDPRSQLSDDAEVLAPESRPGAVEPRAFARARDVLAGEAPADDVDLREDVTTHLAHVGEALRARPVHREHAPAEGIDLDLKQYGAKASQLQTKLESANA